MSFSSIGKCQKYSVEYFWKAFYTEKHSVDIYRDHRSPMNDMMRNFPDPFSMGHRALEGPAGSQRHRQQQGLVPHSGFMGQMGLFSNMDSMFRDMHRQMVSCSVLVKSIFYNFTFQGFVVFTL